MGAIITIGVFIGDLHSVTRRTRVIVSSSTLSCALHELVGEVLALEVQSTIGCAHLDFKSGMLVRYLAADFPDVK